MHYRKEAIQQDIAPNHPPAHTTRPARADWPPSSDLAESYPHLPPGIPNAVFMHTVVCLNFLPVQFRYNFICQGLIKSQFST